MTTNIQNLQTRRPRVYLAGPSVFRPNAKAHLASLAALCERHGLTALLPTDDCAGAAHLRIQHADAAQRRWRAGGPAGVAWP